MRRRSFLTAAAFTGLTAVVLSVVPSHSHAETTVEYEPGAIESALDDGKAVLLDYSATWCGTCAAQKRVMDALREENPAYDEKIVFIRIDWDTYARDGVTTSRNVPRRSTLILLQGEEELGRIVAGTRKDDIKALLDLAGDGSGA